MAVAAARASSWSVNLENFLSFTLRRKRERQYELEKNTSIAAVSIKRGNSTRTIDRRMLVGHMYGYW